MWLAGRGVLLRNVAVFFSFDPTQHGTHTRILLDEGEGPVGEPWEAQPPSAAGPVVERVTHTSFVLV